MYTAQASACIIVRALTQFCLGT